MSSPADPVGAVTVRHYDEAAHAERVISALAERPDGEALLKAAAGAEGVHLVGGAVRDLLLRREPRELDVVIEGDAGAFARLLVRGTGGELTSHDRFGTATVRLGEDRIDVAQSRRETYPAPGTLPEVAPAPLADDLRRRDFTVNAIAVSLSNPPGTLTAAPFALDDLHNERLRILHDESFIDDPTRLLRLGRYAARLGFKVERHTGRLAADALAAGALRGVSGGRIGAELRLTLTEPDPLRALATLARLDILEALQPALSIDTPLARRALDLLPDDGREDLLILAACAWGFASPDGLRRWLDELEFPARDRDIVTVAACEAPAIARAIAPPQPPSRLWAQLRSRPLEAVALAGALGPAAAARLWLDELRHVRLEIDGHDLVAAGVPEGPEIGRRLETALARKLDGELEDGRDAELAAALEDEEGSQIAQDEERAPAAPGATVVRQPIAVSRSSRRRIEERLGLRFPGARRFWARLIFRLQPRSRLRQVVFRHLVRLGFEAANRNDFDAAFLLYAPEVELVSPPSFVEVGFEPTYRGHEARVGVQRRWQADWGEFSFKPEELLDLGERLLVVGRITGVGSSSGAPFDSEWGVVMTLAGGVVVREQFFFDRNEAFAAAGLRESAKEPGE